jgi:hypothetical protein
MTVARPTVFWITISIIALVMLVLLREILLPFAVGMALAYLLVPAVDRLERVGINRGLAALILILVLAVGFVGLLLVMLPALVGELRFFIDEFPRYVTRVQSLAADTGRPWLHRIMGQELRIEESVTHTVEAAGSAWLDDLVRSAWSGGKALLSLLSLLVVVPIVSIYLLTDWDGMIATIDGWVSAKHREDVRSLGREIHDTVAGFVRGQIVICLILAVFYAAALSCHPDRPHRRPDQLCPLSGARRRLRRRGMRGDRPVLARLDAPGRRGRHFPARRNDRRLCAVAADHRHPGQAQPGVADVCAVRLRVSVRLRGLDHCHSAGRIAWGDPAVFHEEGAGHPGSGRHGGTIRTRRHPSKASGTWTR